MPVTIHTDQDLSAEDVIQRFVAERGDLFEEFHLMASAIPATVNHIRRTAGYVHFYENQRRRIRSFQDRCESS